MSKTSFRQICQTVQSLPKFPVPPLQQSVSLYLRYLKPLVSLDQWHEAKKEMEHFCERLDEGPLLQSLLERRAERLDNWVCFSSHSIQKKVMSVSVLICFVVVGLVALHRVSWLSSAIAYQCKSWHSLSWTSLFHHSRMAVVCGFITWRSARFLSNYFLQ